MINLTPLLESCPLTPQSLGNMCLFSSPIMAGLNPNRPAIMATRQGPWTPRRSICERQNTGEFDSYNTPRHDSQMGASSGRICHHNGNGVCICVLHVCACACVYAHLVRVSVSTKIYVWWDSGVDFQRKGGGWRRGALTSVWCMLLWRQQPSESSGLKETDNPDRRGLPRPLSLGLTHSSVRPSIHSLLNVH